MLRKFVGRTSASLLSKGSKASVTQHFYLRTYTFQIPYPRRKAISLASPCDNPNEETFMATISQITAVSKTHSESNPANLGPYAKQAVLLTDEDRAAFDALTDSFHRELSPETAIEHTFFAQIVLATWNLQRANRLESALALSEGLDPLLSTNPTFARIATFRLRAERSLQKCLSEYRKLKAQRPTIEEDTAALVIIRNEPNSYPQSIVESIEKPNPAYLNQNLNSNALRNRTHS